MRESTRQFRQHYRASVAPTRYRGYRHVLLVSGAGAILVVAPWVLLDLSVSVSQVAMTLPVTLVLASLVEYLAHRCVMHRPRPGLRAVFHRHTRQHHRYFRHDDLYLTRSDDLHATLFPPLLLGFFAAIAALLALLAALIFSPPIAAVFFSTCVVYYLLYEVMHATAHIPDTALRRPCWLQRLNALHRRHHAPECMQQTNFNIVLPLGDWLFGTLQLPSCRVDEPTVDAAALLQLLGKK